LRQIQSEHENIVKDGENYVNYYDLYALKDECFDKVDGAFTYTVCLGTKVTQKENGRGNSAVTLGTFSQISSSIELVKSQMELQEE